MNKIKDFVFNFKEFFIVFIIMFLLFHINLPYYINTPGGGININDRLDCSSCSDINGELNMLYVSEYEASIPTYLLSFVIPNWDLEKKSEQQVSNESSKEILKRNKVMLENSIDNAMYVAYTSANKEIKVTNKETVVIATTFSNGLKIGDSILEVDGNSFEDVNDIKKIIKSKKKGDTIKFLVNRDDKEIEVSSKVVVRDKSNVIGVIIVTNYDYDINPKMDIKFRTSESGASGGMMMTLAMYSKLSGNDLIKGRSIAGTGTIDREGNVGEIDGIKYKIMGAVREGVDIVLVPRGNYKEALKVKKDNDYDVTLVLVDTFNDVINYLKK